ncbi:hypothetical protein Tco_1247096 [Tanacetum coccineum]
MLLSINIGGRYKEKWYIIAELLRLCPNDFYTIGYIVDFSSQLMSNTNRVPESPSCYCLVSFYTCLDWDLVYLHFIDDILVGRKSCYGYWVKSTSNGAAAVVHACGSPKHKSFNVANTFKTPAATRYPEPWLKPSPKTQLDGTRRTPQVAFSSVEPLPLAEMVPENAT